MKNIFTLIIFLIGTNLYAQQRIKFTYDTAGNQTQRFVCLCPTAKAASDSIYKTQETLKEEDLISDIELEQVKYYPNPVLEELYVKWLNTNEIYVTNIDLYSQNGQLLRQYTNLINRETTSIAFYNFPDGYYNLVLVYNNGERKTLKIIKAKQ